MDEIKSFRPFLAQFISYDGRQATVRFTCGKCGSHNVKPRKDLHFFQDHFYCGDCGYSKCVDGYPYYYASSCFHVSYEPIYTQLTLF